MTYSELLSAWLMLLIAILLTWAKPFLVSFISAAANSFLNLSQLKQLTGKRLSGNKVIWEVYPAPKYSKETAQTWGWYGGPNGGWKQKVHKRRYMFLLAVLYKVVPKGFILPRIVFAQPGLGFSCSYPHDDGLCWRWGRVECVGIGWRIVFSLQLSGAATHSAVLWRRDVSEELSMRCQDGHKDAVHTDNTGFSFLSRSTRWKLLLTKICLLQWDN